MVYNKIDIMYREDSILNELIDMLNGGNKEELKAFLNLYSKPIYERALALKSDREEARACAKRTMAQVVRLAKQGRLSYEIDAQLMRLTDICCNDAAYENMLLGDMVDEVIAESDDEEAAPAEPVASASEQTPPPPAQQPAAYAQETAAAPEVFEPEAPEQPSEYAYAAPVKSRPVVPFTPPQAAPSAMPLNEAVRQAAAETAEELDCFNHAASAPVFQAPYENADAAEQGCKDDSEPDEDIFSDDADDTFSPAAQRRARREAKKREQEQKRLAAKEAKRKQPDMYDLDMPDDEDDESDGELTLFGGDGEKPGAKVKKPKARRARLNDFDDDDSDGDEDDEDEQRVSPGMVVLIFVLAVIVVLFVWVLIVKLSTMGVINMSDFGFADWFNQNIFKLY